MYTIRTGLRDDIMLTSALDGGPPYKQPVFIRTFFRPVLQPEELRAALRPGAIEILEEPNAGAYRHCHRAL